MQRSALCRSRRELANAYFLAKFGFDTAENEPCQVCPIPRFHAAERLVHTASRGLPRARARAAAVRGAAARPLRPLAEHAVMPTFKFL